MKSVRNSMGDYVLYSVSTSMKDSVRVSVRDST